MGVCNVTPDSFSDGGRYLTQSDAEAHVDRLLAEGADIIDVGGESTRPGAAPVPATEQIRRIESVVRYAAPRACVSVDTTSPEVAEACLRLGASVVNDVSCLENPELADVVARYGSAFVIMHARGPSASKTTYQDIVVDVVADWTRAMNRALGRNVRPESIVMDPGFGFSKTAAESAELLRRLSDVVAAVPAPVLVGASRKSFLSLWAGKCLPEQRLGASIAAALAAASKGASLVRVHDVRESAQAIETWFALSGESKLGGSKGEPTRAEVGHA